VAALPFDKYGIGIAKGMMTTLKHVFRQPITTQYPEWRLNNSKRIRGFELVWVPMKCTGCATCSKACPQGNIEIVTSRGESDFYVIEKFEVDIGRCKSCGLCVEACPFDALFMSRNFELAEYQRRKLVQGKEEVRISDKKQPSAYANPWLEASLPQQSLLVEGERRAR
jgi:formate hydrogenlyase subunit 6/NADH:ubiquinone oxidoreductase subunit I